MSAPKSGGPVDPALIEDLVVANRVLADHGVLDAFGHVSIRHPANPQRYLMSRQLAPVLVTAEDVLEYDLDSEVVGGGEHSVFLERFIHGEMYRARPDVHAVVHSHSPSVIPFGITTVPLKPVYHMAGFLHAGVPNFDIRSHRGMTNMLVTDGALGKALADTLGDRNVSLMRGHGNVVVGPDIKVATYRAIYTEINARLQMQALQLGGPITYLDPEEGKLIDAVQATKVINRPWTLWKRQALGR
jgi:HCOMODA/2-hydroxy-3-carboxy-muconic semialdehyde decarboxylase